MGWIFVGSSTAGVLCPKSNELDQVQLSHNPRKLLMLLWLLLLLVFLLLLSKPQPQPNLNTTVGFDTKMTLQTPPTETFQALLDDLES